MDDLLLGFAAQKSVSDVVDEFQHLVFLLLPRDIIGPRIAKIVFLSSKKD